MGEVPIVVMKVLSLKHPATAIGQFHVDVP